MHPAIRQLKSSPSPATLECATACNTKSETDFRELKKPDLFIMMK